jgi:hypothetical protein
MTSSTSNAIHKSSVKTRTTSANVRSNLTFWPYILQTCKKDLKQVWYKSKLTHIVLFLLIAIVLTVIGEHGLASFSLLGLVVRVVHLLGDIFSERTLAPTLAAFLKDEEEV